ncbi:MAG TPA: phospholipase D-like domain-containing protein [Pyrinomonadaceae bacterium]|jgi:hypothetical protein
MAITVKELYDYLKNDRRVNDYDERLFGYTEKNTILGHAEGYLRDSPHGYWTSGYRRMDFDHSGMYLPVDIETLIGGAEHWVDIVNMYHADEKEFKGVFYERMMNGLLKAARRQDVTVRILYGRPILRPLFEDIAWPVIEDLARRLKAAGLKLKVFVGALSNPYGEFNKDYAWNHSKFVAVDGKVIITGGHNFWSQTYLGEFPIFDLSVRYEGPIARGGHLFANGLWEHVRIRNSHGNPFNGTYSHNLNDELEIENNAPTVGYNQPAMQGMGNIPALWVTNPGMNVFKRSNDQPVLDSTMYIALVEALKTAKTCKISQQDIGSRIPLGADRQQYERVYFPEYAHHLYFCEGRYFIGPLIDGFAAFLLRDDTEELQMVTSPPFGAADYSRGVYAGMIYHLIGYRMRAKNPNLTKETIVKILNDKLKIKYVSFRNNNNPADPFDDTWANGVKKANHAKFWMLDDELFYVGSENLYPNTGFRLGVGVGPDINSSQQDFGVIAGADARTRDTMLNGYYTLAFTYSRPAPPATVTHLRWRQA